MVEQQFDCDIRPAGKRRDGKARFWCHAHQASATGKYGIKLEHCEGSYKSLGSRNVMCLNPGEFAGGVALWGAVNPAYDSTGLRENEGIHVHARHFDSLEKSIDDTFDAVELEIRANLFETKTAYVTRETAVSAYIARCIGNPLNSLFCTYCGEPHLDSEWFTLSLGDHLRREYKSPEKRADLLGLSPREKVEIPVISPHLSRALLGSLRNGDISIGWASNNFGYSIGEIFSEQAKAL